MANLTDMMSKLVSSNTASSLGSRTLPSNTITNPKEELKGITTRSGVAYQGPTIPTPSKVVKQGTKVTKDQVKTPSSQCTAPVQPPVIQPETLTLISEPVVAPVSAPMPNLKSSIPYPSRRDNERRHDQANKQIEKFYEIFKDMTDLEASINLMPLSVWEALSLSELTPTCMTLELADRSVSKPIGIAKDVSFNTSRALIDVHKGELTLCIRNEAITYNLDQTARYSANYNQMTANKIDVICEEHSQEVLGFSDVSASGNPTPYDNLIVSTMSPTLTPFGDSDFLLFEEADTFLAILNSEPLPPLPNHEQYFPSFKKELKACEAKTVKSSIDEPPEVELKDLPHHIEYAFLEGDNKLPVIIAKELGDEEKSALIKVLKSHKRAIAWKLSDIQDCIKAFKTLKKKLMEAPILIALNWDLPFELMCNTSDFTIGAVLGQRHEKHFRPIHYASKTINDAESNYTTIEKKVLAVVYAFEKFRSYLIMNKSIVHTDHSALTYIFAKKDAKERLLR
nr:reverse transcriptase domain-containing protein [Tanacetum cinerariifolium]